MHNLIEPSYKGRLLELDAFRGIAAILVVLFHFIGQGHSTSVFTIGVTAVDLFFIISGFVIFLTLDKVKIWKDFVINRLSRLFPVYFTCVTITFLLKIYIEHESLFKMLPTYLANLTMFQLNIFKVGDLDGSYWTMTVEMLFYFLMLMILLFKQLNAIKTIGLIISLFCLINGTIIKFFYPNINAALSFHVPLINHFCLFFAGILFYKLGLDKRNVYNYILLLMTFIISLLLFDNGGKSWMYFSLSTYISILSVYYLLFFAFLFFDLSFIVNKITLFFGTISYSLYLIHQFIGTHVLMPLFINQFHLNYYLSLLATLLTVILMATFINVYIEKPSMLYIRKKRKIQP